MRLPIKLISLTLALLFIGSTGAVAVSAQQPSSASEAQDLAAGLNPNPPSAPVRCVFIHHSTGQAWLTDGYGNLAIALRDNNYYVSDTNYGWGPSRPDGDAIGSHTDIGNWWEWFRGPSSTAYLNALYSNSQQTFEYSRMSKAPSGPNEVILFKSCFPNSNLRGNPNDPIPPIASNPLRGEDASSDAHTVANAKGIYLDLLNYFKTKQDKLFIIITAPPVSDGTYAGNARAFNQWLVNDYLKNYPYQNVLVFDYYNVLTTNGGNPYANDLNRATGNHHRWWNNAIQHQVAGDHNVTAYPTGDDHPSAAGDIKATGEFVPLLNIAYNKWKASATPTTTTITASNTNPAVGESVTFTVTLKSGTTLLDKPVKLWCTLNGVRIDRGTFNTVNGVYTFSGPFSTKGQVIYHAEFAGDSQYGASAGTVTVNVGTIPTLLTPTSSA
jgi:hypothetical protein